MRGLTAADGLGHHLGDPLVVLGHQAFDRLDLDVLERGVPQHGDDVVLVLPDALGADRQDPEELDDLVPRHLGLEDQLAHAVPVEPECHGALAVAVEVDDLALEGHVPGPDLQVRGP